MKRALLATGLIGIAVLFFASARTLAWKIVERGIQRDFPEVPHLTTDALAALLADGPAPLLLDVRTEAEYAVSHLPGARRVDPGADSVPALADLPTDTPVVVYCSVGYRSADLARRLRQAGFTRVFNLRGSLFQWAREGRPLVQAGRPAHQVHPYNRRWGLLVRRPLRADVPAVHN